MMRKSVRTFSLWLIGVPVAIAASAWRDSAALVGVVVLTGPIVLAGLILFAANLSPHAATDPETMRCRLRRQRLFITSVFVAALPRVFVYPAHRHFLREIAVAELVLVVATLTWPRRYWPIRPLKTANTIGK